MKHIRTAFAAALLFAACSSAASAQQPAPPASAPSLTGKIAVIDTSAFADERSGIRRIVQALRQVESEFKPQSDALQQMRARYDGLVKQINAGTGDQAALQRAADEAEQLKRDIDRRSEDAKAAYDKRVSALVGPIQQDVGAALDAYAKQYGIALIIDASQVPVIVTGQSVDITDHFISVYNQRNPAAGGAGAPAAGAPAAPAATRPAATATPATRRP
jgi:Skp family chaperone for outer membrane proteins